MVQEKIYEITERFPDGKIRDQELYNTLVEANVGYQKMIETVIDRNMVTLTLLHKNALPEILKHHFPNEQYFYTVEVLDEDSNIIYTYDYVVYEEAKEVFEMNRAEKTHDSIRLVCFKPPGEKK